MFKFKSGKIVALAFIGFWIIHSLLQYWVTNSIGDSPDSYRIKMALPNLITLIVAIFSVSTDRSSLTQNKWGIPKRIGFVLAICIVQQIGGGVLGFPFGLLGSKNPDLAGNFLAAIIALYICMKRSRIFVEMTSA